MGAASTKNRRITVTFTGRVQGVGFRYTVVSLAGQYPVTGTVRNEWDGSVRMEVEGQAEHIEALMRDIMHSRLGTYITEAHRNWAEATDRLNGFRITY